MSKWTSATSSLESTLDIIKAQKVIAHRKSASDDTHNIGINNQTKSNCEYGSERNCRLPKFSVLSTGSLGDIYDEHRRTQLIANPTSASIDSRGSSAYTAISGGSNHLQIGVAIGAASAIASSIIAHGVGQTSSNIFTHKNYIASGSLRNGLNHFSNYPRHLQSSTVPSTQAQLYSSTAYTTGVTQPKLSKVLVVTYSYYRYNESKKSSFICHLVTIM